MLSKTVSKSGFQVDALDGLRGLAALIVVMSHTSNSEMYFLPYLDMSGIGKSGVFLFFLLSSFLLTLPLLHLGHQIFSINNLVHYTQRRFFRIYPLFSLFLLVGVVSTFVFQTLGVNDLGVPFALNWDGFFNHLLLQQGLGVTWSIAVEFKFYFVLPFLAFIASAALKKGVVIALSVMSLLIVAAHIYSPADEAYKNDMRLAPYLPIFLFGMTLAVIQYSINQKLVRLPSPRLIHVCSVGAILGLIFMTPAVYSVLVTPVDRYFFHQDFLLYTALWAVILFSAVNVKGPIQFILQLPALRFMGFISFSLYLFHSSCIGALKFLNIRSDFDAWIVLFISSLAAYLSFLIIEKPTSKFKLNLKPRLIKS